MKQKIEELMTDYNWVCHNSVTFGDGSMVLLDIEFYSKDNYFIGPIADTTLESYLKYNSDNLSSFDVFATTHNGEYKVHVGDGSLEENGIIYVTSIKDNTLLWFAFFEKSDCFKEVTVDTDNVIHATTASNVVWNLSISNPLDIKLLSRL